MIWERVKRYVKASPPQLWAKDIEYEDLICDSIDKVFCNQGSPCGFLLRRVESKCLTDSRTPWLARSFGYTIPCSDKCVDLLEDETIAIDWDVSVLQVTIYFK